MKKRWKQLIAIVSAVALSATQLAPVSVQAQSASQKTGQIADDDELKIATYNIAASRGVDTTAIGEVLKKQDIDIVGFQEVDKNTDRNKRDMLKEIADTAGFDYYFRKNIDYQNGEYGIGLAADGDLENEHGENLESGGYEGRGWQCAQVQVGDKTVSVYNTHLTWEDPKIREEQMKTVFDVMDEDPTEYKILTGDFNAQESNDEFDVYLRNYLIANGKDGEWLDTYIPFDATMKTNAIDNIITTRNIKIHKVEATEEENVGSDHRLLVATCELLDEEEVSTQLLDKTVDKAKALLKETDRYTEESLSALKDVIDEVEKAKKDTQEQVNESIDLLEDAIEKLERVPVTPSTPVAYWDFDGENPLQDKTGNGNDGVEKETVQYVDGLENMGKALSTKDGYVSVEKATDDLNLGVKDFSVGFWYKATNPGSWAAVLGDKDWSSGANPGMAVVQGQGQFYTTYAANGHGQQENIVSGTASKVYDGKWHYIAAVLDRDQDSTLYVDGNKIAATSIASTADMDATVSTPFNIGADGKGNYRIDSLIDDVKVYRCVLSEEEIMDEYLRNRDKTEELIEKMVEKTEKYLDNLVIDPNETKQLPSFESEDGKIVSKIFCSENDIVIDDKGNVLRQPLVDKKVQISYIVQQNKAGVAYDDGTLVQNKWITVKGKSESGKNKKPVVVPTMQEWKGEDKGTFSFNKNNRIVVAQDEVGELGKAAEITKSDIKELFGIDVEITSDTPKAGDVVLTFKGGDEKLGEQGYELKIGDYVTITGTAYRGVFFGTRSLLQGMLTSDDKTIARGTAVDYPNYPIRKFMLDLGRKYFPMWYLQDLIKYASWLKLTDFQSHISEDTFNSYSAFRLESDIPNLTSKDGYYTKDEYRDFQRLAGDYGIRVITEIDGPAHARRFIELGNYEGAPEKYKNLGLNETEFNLSEEGGARERVFGLMDEILEEFLGGDDPVVITDAFNIGMDEYSGNKDDLRAYAVHMYDQVVNKYHKTAFGWDSDASLANENYPKDQYPMDDIVIDYWKWEEVSGGLKKLMDQGYKVVNGDHRWYIVPGAQIGFYDYAYEERLYNEVSAGNMVGWYGNGTIFPQGHPSIMGGTMLLWNDRGMFAGYTVNDIFARQRSQYPYLAQNYWYGHEEGETFDQFKEKLNTIEVGPGLDNLYKDIDSKGEVVYDFDMETLKDGKLKDQSGNGYDASVVGAKLTDGPDGKQLTFDGNDYMEAKHKALKWPYTAVFDLTIDEKQEGDIVLFEETMPEQECVKKDGVKTGQERRVIELKEQDDGTYRLTYSRENFSFEHDYVFKKGQPYRIAFCSDESKPTGGEYDKWNQPNTLYVNGELVSTLQGPKKPDDFNGQWWVDSPSMNMPLQKIGQNLMGSLDNFQLYNRLLTEEEIKDLGGFENPDEKPEPVNLALNKPTTASSSKLAQQDAKYATDGSMDTRWGSNYNSSVNDPFDKEEWLQIDLQDTYALGQVKLYWQDAYAQEYTIQVSEDGVDFKDAKTVTGGDGKEDIVDLAGETGRYVRIKCTKAVPSNDGWKWNYGYSLFEVEVYEKQEESSISTAVLEYALELAKKADTTNVIPSIVEKFENAVAHGNDILSKVQAGDSSVTQQQVDESWQDLIKIMQYLEFKQGDKTDLAKVIALAEEMNGKLDSYLDEGKEDFVTALDAAKAVYEDENAMQEEVDASWMALLTAMSKLNLKPDKDALDKLIQKAEGLKEADYEKEGFASFRTALASAKEVFADDQATKEEVDTAAGNLENAIAKLVPADNAAKEETNNITVSADETVSDNKDGKTDKTTDSVKTAKSAKTGDMANVAVPLAGLIMSAAALLVLKKRK